MRTWRVGTFSMGLTLILLGAFLVLSQIFSWEPAYVMLSWWPVILIILGIEILVYLFLGKKENPIVKYDLFSIFLISIIAVVSIGFVTVNATGVLAKVNDWVNREIREMDLPSYNTKLSGSIQRVVVNTGSDSLSIETGETNEVAVFGTYTMEIGTDQVPFKEHEDYLFTEQRGDTLFITFKNPPETFNTFPSHIDRKATLIIPNSVQVEVDANYQSLNITPRTFLGDWIIMNARNVNLFATSDLNMQISAQNIDHIYNEDDNWELWNEQQSGTLQLGKGTYVMNILDSGSIAVIQK